MKEERETVNEEGSAETSRHGNDNEEAEKATSTGTVPGALAVSSRGLGKANRTARRASAVLRSDGSEGCFTPGVSSGTSKASLGLRGLSNANANRRSTIANLVASANGSLQESTNAPSRVASTTDAAKAGVRSVGLSKAQDSKFDASSSAPLYPTALTARTGLTAHKTGMGLSKTNTIRASKQQMDLETRERATHPQAQLSLQGLSTPSGNNPTLDEDISIQEHEGSLMEDGSTPPRSHTAVDSPNDDLLAVANLVAESEQLRPQAEYVNKEEQHAKTRAKKKVHMRRTIACVGLGLFLVVFAVLLAVFLPRKYESVTAKSPQVENTTTAPSTTLAMHVQHLVSNISSAEAFHFSDTPQTKALEWLMQDPSLPTYSDWRIQQRYILATFYFATGGSVWNNNTGWLDHSIHECQWYTNQHYLPPNIEHAMNAAGVELYASEPARAINHAPCGNADGDPRKPSDTFKYLVFIQNNLVGTLPREIFQLTSLRGINLSFNPGLYGSIGTEIGLLTDLNVLTFVQNPMMRGTVPTEMGLLSGVTDVVMQQSPMTGSLPSELFLLSNSLLVFFWEASNGGIQGTIPKEIGSLDQLETLALIGQATGTIPSEVQDLENLRMLSFSSNELRGVIPSEVGRMTQLTFLGFYDNLLSGEIPSELGRLTNLSFGLSLRGNGLTGRIPSHLQHLTKLRRLFLAHNDLVGPIPLELGGLTSSTLLQFHNNDLTGTVPAGICGKGQGSPESSAYVGTGLTFDCSGKLCGCSWCACSNDTHFEG